MSVIVESIEEPNKKKINDELMKIYTPIGEILDSTIKISDLYVEATKDILKD